MNFKEAKDLGAVHYDGAPCKGCGNTLRYTSTYGCVMCKRTGKTTLAAISAEKQQEQALRDAAATLGQQRYQGRDCSHGHGGLRYSTSGACVACRRVAEVAANDRKRAERVAQKERRKAPPHSPSQPHSRDGWLGELHHASHPSNADGKTCAMKIRRLTKAQLQDSAANGVLKAALTDQRGERSLDDAENILALPDVPDFEARAEARIQAARAGS